MKIVFVVPLLAPYAISRFKELAKNKDVELHVIVEKDTYKERTGWKYQEIEGVYTYLLDAQIHEYDVHHKKSGYTIESTHMFSKGLRKLVNKISPDFCIVCNSTQLLYLLGPRKYKLGVIVEDTLRAEEGRKFINKIIKKFLLKTADVYFPFSSDAERFLEKNGITKNRYRSSWSIDPALFETQKKNENISEMKNEFSLNPTKKIYTIVSSLIPLKGISQFLEAWKAMPTDFLKNSELHIIGDGPLENELKDFIRMNNLMDTVILRGNLPYAKVAEFLKCTDVFVLPTLQDLCSLAVFEAVMCGLPVMTTIYNGAKDLVLEGKNGFVFDSENKQSTIAALTKMSASDLNVLSAKSKEISKEYTNEIVMKEFYKTLKNLS